MSAKTPQRVGRYEIKTELGRGGMATVYLAHDPSFGRDVALKLLPGQFLHDPTFRGRFEREARTIAALEHSAIVPVYDFGEEEGQPFLIMRYMSGGSLLDKMRAGPIAANEVENILRRMGSALDYAHSQGIVHRDLKPGNILFDQQGYAFLSDFGIAKLAESTSTYTGSAIIGTPAYMSPEQIHGEKDIDGRSDIYALGIILFEMLTGHSPYRADTPAKLMMKHILEPVPRIRQEKPGLSPAYDTVVGRALAKDRAERYQTATSMAEDLKKAATGEMEPVFEGTLIEPPPPQQPEGATVIERPTPTPAPSPSPTMMQKTQVEAPPVRPGAAPAAQPQPVEKKRGMPIWALGLVGLLILLCLGAVTVGGLLATGVIGGDDETPTAVAVVQDDTPDTDTDTTTVPDETDGDDADEPPTDTPAPPTDTPEPPTATPTPEPTEPPITFHQVQDSTRRIEFQFPEQWSTNANDLVVMGSPNIGEWTDGFSGERDGDVTVSGVYMTVVDVAPEATVDEAYLDDFLGDYTFPDNCDFDSDDQDPYDDGTYEGTYNQASCDDGVFILLLVFDPDEPTFFIWIEFFLMDDLDEEVLAELLDSMSVEPPEVVELPTPTPTSPPAPTRPPATPTPNNKAALLNQMKATQGDMRNLGGMIDNAVATGFINCQDVVNIYDRVVAAPTFNVDGDTQTVRDSYQSYRSSISIFSSGVRDLAENCRSILGGSGGSIPFQQWGPARQSINNALDVLNPAIERLEAS